MKELVDEGRYDNANEVVQAGLRVFEDYKFGRGAAWPTNSGEGTG